ncbi:hypothetical protein ACMYYO_03800 [Dermacoccaceae bacterium W4C1]
MSTHLRRLGTVAALVPVAVSGAVGLAPAASAAISCSTSAGSGDEYPGPSASAVYDAKFNQSSIAVPHLSTRTPQGLAVWPRWNGGNDLLLVTAYKDGQDSYLIGLDRSTGKHVGTVAVAEGHVGGVTVSNGWAFVSGRSNTIRKYSLSALRSAMKKAGTPYLKQTGEARKVYGSSFLSSYGGYLYAGKFNETGRDKMYSYKVASNGSLTTQSGSWEIPTKTQGLLVTADRFVYSTSFGRSNRSNVYVVKRSPRALESALVRCFRAPSMSEGIAAGGSTAYLLYESGSYAYPNALNRITKLHTAPLSTLK